MVRVLLRRVRAELMNPLMRILVLTGDSFRVRTFRRVRVDSCELGTRTPHPQTHISLVWFYENYGMHHPRVSRRPWAEYIFTPAGRVGENKKRSFVSAARVEGRRVRGRPCVSDRE